MSHGVDQLPDGGNGYAYDPDTHEYGAAQASAPSRIAPQAYAGLSPQMVMLYVRRQLLELDGQANSIMSDLQAKRSRLAELNEEARVLRQLRDRADQKGDDILANDGNNDAAERDGLRTELEALPDVRIGNRLDGGLSKAEVESMLEDIDAKIGEINDQSEFDMMRLNSLMSKRQQAFELGSQLLRDQHQTAMTAIQNTALG